MRGWYRRLETPVQNPRTGVDGLHCAFRLAGETPPSHLIARGRAAGTLPGGRDATSSTTRRSAGSLPQRSLPPRPTIATSTRRATTDSGPGIRSSGLYEAREHRSLRRGPAQDPEKTDDGGASWQKEGRRDRRYAAETVVQICDVPRRGHLTASDSVERGLTCADTTWSVSISRRGVGAEAQDVGLCTSPAPVTWLSHGAAKSGAVTTRSVQWTLTGPPRSPAARISHGRCAGIRGRARSRRAARPPPGRVRGWNWQASWMPW